MQIKVSPKTSLYEPIIRMACEVHNVDFRVILAIVDVESAGEPNVARYEPNWSYLVTPQIYAKGLGQTVDTEVQQQKMSWGLMQVMGSVAREHGYNLHLPRLTDPRIGLEYGIRHYAKFYKKYSSDEAAIRSYNAGSPVDSHGNPKATAYFDKVQARLNWFIKIN